MPTIFFSTINKKVELTNNFQINLKLIDSPGDIDYNNNNIISKVLFQIKALFMVFDLTKVKSFDKIKQNVNIIQKVFNEINSKGDTAKPKTFNELPILIIGNKADLASQIKVNQTEVQEYINKLQKEMDLVYINYHQISAKQIKNVEDIFQDIFFFYYQARINIKKEPKLEEKKDTNTSTNKEEKNEIKDKKKPILNKNLVIFHQMLDKIKRPLISEISKLKEENKKNEINLEKKIQKMMAEFNKEKRILMEKINLYENKDKEINLKFKINNIKDIITIKAKTDSKIFDILNMLCDLYPGLEKEKIKGFAVEGKKEMKIDEMKTISENKLENNSILIINY